MNTHIPLAAGFVVLAFAGCAHVVHVPPGTSLEVALARKPEVLRIPTPAPGSVLADNAPQQSRSIYVAPVEPGLPMSDRVEAGAEAYTRAMDLMADGRNAEAIGAFEEAVQADPNYGEAWRNLGVAYEKAGDAQKARDAFRRSQGVTPQAP